jgi:hypothetical protein
MSKPIQVAAYYFPDYHPDARNEARHGKGWTEWELMKLARPRYPGNRQPKVPAWGYFDESDPQWAAKEIDLAADSGIDAFIYDWYHYEDGPYLEGGLDNGFLNAPNRNRMKFALMWANHDWLDMHPAQASSPPALLSSGRVSREAFDRITDHVIERYFSQPNYWTIDGEPYFSIYEIGTLIDGLGGVSETRDALASFRAKTIAAGFPGLHLNCIAAGLKVLPCETGIEEPERWLPHLGFSSVGSYVWVHYYYPDWSGFPLGDMKKAAERNYEVWQELRDQFTLPHHPNVTMGWDPSPRTVQSDAFEPRGGTFTAVLEDDPVIFKQALEKAKAFVSREECKQKIITINAWNEWTEGSYLLPDTAHGTAYTDAIREVFGAK